MKFKSNIKSITAFAPATCANVAVGFDILGFSLDCVGDEVVLTLNNQDGLVIENIIANEALPYEIEKNVVSWVINKFCQQHQLPCNFKLTIKKGIPLGSGMGGSAASAVAALTALNGFLDEPVDLEILAYYAIDAEGLVSGSPHADNVVPCLYGGMTLTKSMKPLELIQLPLLELYCVLVHPNIRVDTKDARAILPDDFPLAAYVKQSANLASFISALYENRIELIKGSLQDMLIEPYRSKLIKGFAAVKNAALNANALGVSLSGSGPSVFALAKSIEDAKKIKAEMITAFAKEGVESSAWINQLNNNAAKIIYR